MFPSSLSSSSSLSHTTVIQPLESTIPDGIQLKNAAEILLEISQERKYIKRELEISDHTNNHKEDENETVSTAHSSSSDSEEGVVQEATIHHNNTKTSRKVRRGVALGWQDRIERKDNVFVAIHELPETSKEAPMYKLLMKHGGENVWINRLRLKHIVMDQELNRGQVAVKLNCFFQHIKRQVRHKIIDEREAETVPGMVMCVTSTKEAFVRVNRPH